MKNVGSSRFIRIYQHEKENRHHKCPLYCYNGCSIYISNNFLKASGEVLGVARKRSYIYGVNEARSQ